MTESHVDSSARVGLVGCVKAKKDAAARARNLYVSPLFEGRRRYVERTCDQWFVLSALHGVVSPDEVIEPYDLALADCSRADRRAWSTRAVEQLDQLLGGLEGLVVEVHAGAAYRDFGLVAGLNARGASVDVPAAGLRQGEQLAFYARPR